MRFQANWTRATRVRSIACACAALALAWPGSALATSPNAPAAETSSGPGTVMHLAQGWSADLRNLFYYTPQGSRILPLSVFLTLETADGSGRFADPANLAQYGLIPPDGPHPLNPGGLPIGFAVDPRTEGRPLGPDVGLTCAACHTNEITKGGTRIRIDGGTALFDFDVFYRDLVAVVRSSRCKINSERFHRLADALLQAPAPTPADTLCPSDARALNQTFDPRRANIQNALAALSSRLQGDAAIRHPRRASGFGRVDALTQIVNALAVEAAGEPLNLWPVSAPVAYPHLWLSPQLEFVQWNPIAASPIGRNTGEVLGVFAGAHLKGNAAQLFKSDALTRELFALESWVERLTPPKWPEDVLGTIDRALADQGRAIYADQCASCHALPDAAGVYPQTDPAENIGGKTFIKIRAIPIEGVGTDPHYVNHLLSRLIRVNPDMSQALFGGRPIVSAPEFFLQSVGAIVARGLADEELSRDEQLAYNGFRLTPEGKPYDPRRICKDRKINCLKAGPLAGIWASPPYLHNGSVPTVYELLSPPDERRAVFYTGGTEYDAARMGYVSDGAPGRFRFDTRLPGNRNIGHAFPPQGLTPDERRAVVEYLKTL